MLFEKRKAGAYFVRVRVPVFRWAAFYHVGDVTIFIPGQLYGLEHFVEVLPRLAHKWSPRSVLIRAGPFANDHHQGVLDPFVRHRVGSCGA